MRLYASRLWTALLSASWVSGTATGQPCAPSDLTVETKNGIVHGVVNEATPGVREFLGIPFAKPPLGDLRFAPPQPAEPFGEINATTLPLSCMQYLTSNHGVWEDLVLEFNQAGKNSTDGLITEDCLYLSVFGPRGNSENLPVIVWIYGGTFRTGGMNIPYQIPRRWVQRSQDHIVVLFNYRINAFGFSNAAGLEDGERNVGLLDQRLAVEWVRDNIADFGGDATRIGLWGQSAGAVSVAYYSYEYHDDPIVSSLIMNSGSELLDLTTYDPSSSNFTFLASQFGCGGLEAAEELSCMRKVDAYAIEDFLHAYQDNGTAPAIDFAPVVDEKTVFSDYHARALAGNVAKIPTILGSNTQDGVPFMPYDPDGVNVTAAFALTLGYFFCPAWKSATTRVAAGAQVWRYEYAGNFTNISPKGWLGAWHGAELPLLFGTHDQYRGASTPLEYATSHALQDAWVAFVSHGEVGLILQEWPSYDIAAGGLVREFGRTFGVQFFANTTDWEAQCPEEFQP